MHNLGAPSFKERGAGAASIHEALTLGTLHGVAGLGLLESMAGGDNKVGGEAIVAKRSCLKALAHCSTPSLLHKTHGLDLSSGR